jgi:hypothetical protein
MLCSDAEQQTARWGASMSISESIRVEILRPTHTPSRARIAFSRTFLPEYLSLRMDGTASS